MKEGGAGWKVDSTARWSGWSVLRAAADLAGVQLMAPFLLVTKSSPPSGGLTKNLVFGSCRTDGGAYEEDRHGIASGLSVGSGNN